MPAPQERLSAALADRYRIERELGQGGMATVFLAEDLKHKRKVAVKVLKPELAAVLGAERFVQEITTTASLQHPHILPLFDSGTADGFLFYVMPFIDGETLRSKLDRETQLSVDEAVRIAIEVAEALHYAHEHGVIHRDIKPENILLANGRPMVADFGIALAVSAAAGGRMTETGLSLGTPHYMSPEQATADKAITARSDVYSLASVLYEMLTGEPPHMGTSAQQIIMKIIAERVKPATELRKSVPEHVSAALEKALEKLPADRFATAAEFVAALKDASTATRIGVRGATMPQPRVGRERVLAVVAVLALLAAGASWLRRTPQAAPIRQQVVLWTHQLPSAMAPGATVIASQAAIAPDGSSIVYTDSTAVGRVLMRKRRDEAVATVLEGTEGGLSPFFSPDGAWVGFVTLDGRVRKVRADGGGVITLATNGNVDYRVGTWSENGRIYYASVGNLISSVDAENAQRPDTTGFRFAGSVSGLQALPGGRALLMSVCPGNCAIESWVSVVDLTKSDSIRPLIRGVFGAAYASSGHLVYTDRAGGLFAIGFDLDRLTTTGGAAPVIPDVAPGSFVLSASGDALYVMQVAENEDAELVWVDRGGRVTSVDSSWRARFEYPALSPDGRTIAVSTRGATTDLWLQRLNSSRRKVTAPGPANWRASWSPSGDTMYFVSIRDGGTQNDAEIRRVPTDLSAASELVHSSEFGAWEVEASRDGRWLVIRLDEEGGNSNIRYRARSGDTTLKPLVVDPGQTTNVALSPDGRWLAFSDDGGSGAHYDLIVAAFPAMTPRLLVSRNGGIEPRWSRDGRELYFKSQGNLMAVRVAPGNTLDLGNPQLLFPLTRMRTARNRPQYDVAADGRFLMIRDPVAGPVAPVVYATDFLTQMRAALK